MLESLRAGIADVRQPFRKHCLGFPREGAHGALQLAREALRRILSRGLYELPEPLGGFVRVRRDRTVDRTLELFHLPAGEVVEPGAHALHRVGFFPLSLLHQLALAAGHPTFELLECPATVGCVRLELAPHDVEGVVQRPGQFRAQPRDARALLLALGRQPLGIGGEPELDLAEQLLQSLFQLGDPRLRRLGDAIEILRPPGEPLLGLRLNLVELLAERRGRVVLSLRDEGAPLLRDLPLLRLEQRARVGLRAREC